MNKIIDPPSWDKYYGWVNSKLDSDQVLTIAIKIEFENETIELNEGEMIVVPKGVEHKPYAESECKVMLVEPRGVVNTGEADSELTADNDVWI